GRGTSEGRRGVEVVHRSGKALAGVPVRRHGGKREAHDPLSRATYTSTPPSPQEAKVYKPDNRHMSRFWPHPAGEIFRSRSSQRRTTSWDGPFQPGRDSPDPPFVHRRNTPHRPTRALPGTASHPPSEAPGLPRSATHSLRCVGAEPGACSVGPRATG